MTAALALARLVTKTHAEALKGAVLAGEPHHELAIAWSHAVWREIELGLDEKRDTTGSPCCRCCEAADERGELDHELGDDCPYPRCDWCQP